RVAQQPRLAAVDEILFDEKVRSGADRCAGKAFDLVDDELRKTGAVGTLTLKLTRIHDVDLHRKRNRGSRRDAGKSLAVGQKGGAEFVEMGNDAMALFARDAVLMGIKGDGLPAGRW